MLSMHVLITPNPQKKIFYLTINEIGEYLGIFILIKLFIKTRTFSQWDPSHAIDSITS